MHGSRGRKASDVSNNISVIAQNAALHTAVDEANFDAAPKGLAASSQSSAVSAFKSIDLCTPRGSADSH
ncbi:hypothetical protein PSAC2689_70233 [Paraburkholderia sacchari]